MILNCAGRPLNLDRPQIMGVLNVTPDSFSDGGRFARLDEALERAEAMVNQGAAIIDVGGESTRPGAPLVSLQEELDRVLPVVEVLSSRIDAVISLDTSTPQVMRAGVAAGAGLINDVRALEREGALQAAADLAVPVCLMHMQGSPQTMQDAPSYSDVLEQILLYLQGRVAAAEALGVRRENILLDPGFGFGKTLQHNLLLLKHLDVFLRLELPVLVGMSRKSMIGAVLGRDLDERLSGSLALAALAVVKGANIIRVHDVAETADVVKMVHAVLSA